MPDGPVRVLLLGSTGSIGVQTEAVVAHLNALASAGGSRAYRIVGLASGRRLDDLAAQARRLGVTELALAREDDAAGGAAAPPGVTLRTGPDAAERLVREVEADLVLSAVVGFAGLPATMAAIELGRDVAIANKETLVAAGALVTGAASRSGSRLLPVDSEHSAIWQCLASRSGEAAGHVLPACPLPADVERVILTASGGPFRTWDRERIASANVEDALRHPTWDMGAKVTIDCASLTNKALELIEAHWLFDIPASKLGAVVHPQSIVHSFVEFADGSVIAQLGAPDMRTPIQHALTFPERRPGVSTRLRFDELSGLDFEPPDLERFPALGLGLRVIEAGGGSGAVFNAANERAVEAFMGRKIPFGRIPELASGALDALGVTPVRSMDDVMEADRAARAWVASRLG